MRIGTARQLGALAQQRRLDLGLSALALARRVGVSRKWLHDFEAGKGTVQLALALHVVAALDLQIQIEPVPVEAGEAQ